MEQQGLCGCGYTYVSPLSIISIVYLCHIYSPRLGESRLSCSKLRAWVNPARPPPRGHPSFARATHAPHAKRANPRAARGRLANPRVLPGSACNLMTQPPGEPSDETWHLAPSSHSHPSPHYNSPPQGRQPTNSLGRFRPAP